MTTESLDRDEATRGFSRRDALGVCSLGLLGVAGLAACGDDAAAGTGTTPDSTPTDSTPTDSTPTSAGPAATALVKVSDVAVGSAVSVEAAGKQLIVSMPAADAPVAFEAVCPHKFVTVTVKGDELFCPAHGSTFDLKTGANLSGPAAGKPLPSVAVNVVGGEVVIA